VPSFAQDIRVLFRESDRLEMDYIFDLWEYDEVVENAESILLRLEDESMPCDGPWPDEKIELFRAWIAEGFPP